MSAVSDELRASLHGEVLWLGRKPPRADMAIGQDIFESRSGYRLPAKFHQAFDLVLCTETDIGRVKQWPLVLDEALRALKPGGRIVLQGTETGFLSIFQLANFLEKWTQGQVRPIRQALNEGRYQVGIQLTHTHPRAASIDDFTFAVVTDGRKPALVARFVDSIRKASVAGGRKSAILVCGPCTAIDHLPDKSDVRLVEQDSAFEALGWITKKKNLLVRSAMTENIMVAHDRYYAPEDFFASMEAFGGDFDVVVPSQKSVTGARIPDWVMTADSLNWTTPGWMEPADYHPHTYVNGGVIIAKRRCLEATPWNDLLFWGQAEDVEMSRRLAEAGVTPRLAPRLVVQSDQPRPDFFEAFEGVPYRSESYVSTARPSWTEGGDEEVKAASRRPALKSGAVLSLKSSDQINAALKVGLVVSGARALGWDEHAQRSQFSFFSDKAAPPRWLGLRFNRPLRDDDRIWLNGRNSDPHHFFRWVEFPLENIEGNRPRNVHVECRGERLAVELVATSDGPFINLSGEVVSVTFGNDAFACLALDEEWMASDKHTTWTRGPEAILPVPAPVGEVIQVSLVLEAPLTSDTTVSIYDAGELIATQTIKKKSGISKLTFSLRSGGRRTIPLMVRSGEIGVRAVKAKVENHNG